MSIRWRRRDDTDSGQVAIEFALIMPLLLAFILFFIDIALFGFSYVGVTNAVREGARCGAVGASDAAIESRVESTSGIGLGGVENVTIARGNDIGTDITVSADYNYEMITPISLVPGISGTWSFTKASTMRMEMAEPSGGYVGTC